MKIKNRITYLLSIVIMLIVVLTTVLTCMTVRVCADENGEITYVLDDCDTARNCLTGVLPDKTNFVQGTGSLYSSNEGGRQEFMFYGLDQTKLPAFEDAYLEFYYYIYDISNLGDGQIELHSKGYSDVGELYYNYSIATAGLSQGWNFISVPLTAFQRTDSSFDYNKLTGMRIYALPSKYAYFENRVDYIVLTNRSHMQEVVDKGINVQGTPYLKPDLIVSENVLDESNVSVLIGGVLLGVTGLAAVGIVVVLLVKRGKKS